LGAWEPSIYVYLNIKGRIGVKMNQNSGDTHSRAKSSKILASHFKRRVHSWPDNSTLIEFGYNFPTCDDFSSC
jgi:hypothetical protein